MNVNPSSKINETVSWVGKWTFVLAAAGSAVGLGNIWGFPYKAGTEGGGAFVLIYLLCILAVGLPIVFQALVNMAVAVQLFPVTGQPLPLISSGGTSIWMTCLAIGIIQSVRIGSEIKEGEVDEELSLIHI